MMKYFLSIITTVFALTASAQFIFIPEEPVKASSGTIEKHEGIQPTDSIPFSAILIIDSRYDTTSFPEFENSSTGFMYDSANALKDRAILAAVP